MKQQGHFRIYVGKASEFQLLQMWSILVGSLCNKIRITFKKRELVVVEIQTGFIFLVLKAVTNMKSMKETVEIRYKVIAVAHPRFNKGN